MEAPSESGRFCLAHRHIQIRISQRGLRLRHEPFPRDLEHGGDDAWIVNVAGANLTVDHHAACGGEIHHQRFHDCIYPRQGIV